MNRYIWKFELGIIILNTIFAIVLFLTLNRFNAIMALVLLGIILVGAYFGKIRDCFSFALLSVYTWFVGPFSIVIASFSPSIFSTRLEHSVAENISKKDIIMKYCFYLILFYLVFCVIYTIVEPYCCKKSKHVRGFKVGGGQYQFPMACFFSFFELVVRKKYNINVPGHVPTIRFAGVILFTFRAIGMFFLFLSLYKNVSIQKVDRFRYYRRVIMIAVITQLPTIIIGKRGSFFNTIVIVVLYTGLYKFDILHMKYQKRKRIITIAVFTLLVLLLGIGITNLVRIGEFEAVGFLVQRFTGLLDGTIALANMGNRYPFSAIDYITTLVFSKNITSNGYYTNYILGFPLEAIHSNALPVFVGASFYGGAIGVIIIAAIEGIIFLFLEKNIKCSLSSQKRKGVNVQDGIGLYCSLYAMWLLVTSHLIDGNITNWKDFIPIMLCYLFGIFIRNNSRVIEA